MNEKPHNRRIAVRRLTSGDVTLFRALLATFGAAFEETYCGSPPGERYLRDLLERADVIALTAL
jgi:hypothetical protein